MPTMVWKFVDSPVAAPATLFDMNNWNMGATLDFGDDNANFDISPPPLRRVKAVNNFGDGSLNTSESYENRILKFRVGLTGTKSQKIASLSALEDELYKPRNLLMYQPDSSRSPVFFRTVRSDDYILKNSGGSAEVWMVDCNVEADPFAIGLRQDIAQVTVNNDPAAASGNKTFWDITGVIGDVPTEAFVRISDLGAGGKAFLATRAFNNPTSLTLFAQAETATLGADTTAVADTAASSVVPATGVARSQTTFTGTPGWSARVTFASSLPSGSDLAALRGRYRVIARIAGITSAANVSLRWRQSNAGDSIPGQPVTLDIAPPNWQHVDLGVLEFPPPQQTPATIGYSGLTSQQAANPLQIEAIRNSGAGGLLIDWVALLPADERLCSIFQFSALTSGWLCLDGPNDSCYGLASGSTPFGSTRILDSKQGIVTRQGGLPMLVPAITNRWYLFHNPSANNTTETVDISYWPKYREVA
jgi:hypothetical protein